MKQEVPTAHLKDSREEELLRDYGILSSNNDEMKWNKLERNETHRTAYFTK